MTPRGLRNNNPGNIRISNTNYKGEIKPSQDRAFKQFESMPYGYRAMFVLIHTYKLRYGLDTIRKIISRYAPDNENNTEVYINRVSKESGINTDEKLDTMSPTQMIPMIAAMSLVENGIPANPDDVKTGWQLYQKHKP